MQKRILAGLLAATLSVSLISTSYAAGSFRDVTAPSAATPIKQVQTLAYEDLEQQVRTSGISYLTIEETISSIEALDYDQIKEDLRDALNMMASAQWGLLQLRELTGQELDNYTYNTLGQNYSSLEDTFEDLKDGELQKDNAGIIRQLRDAQNQMVAAAKSLYVALLEMENGRQQLERTIASTARTAAEMELRHQRGQISDLQLSQVKNGQVQLDSAMATLERNIKLYTAQLQSLAGMELTGELILTEVPEITTEQLAGMEYQTDLEKAKAASYTLYDADETLADAKEDYDDAAHEYGYNEKRYEFVSARHTYQAAQYTHEAAFQSFEMSFMTAYTAVEEYQTALKAAQSAYALEKHNFAAQELKYQQGTLSQNNYLAAQDTLKDAENAVTTAKHNLFTAWLTYEQAVELGILN